MTRGASASPAPAHTPTSCARLRAAQSYLDVETSAFSRSLTLAYPDYMPDFRYHGANVYALLVSKYGETTVTGRRVSTFAWVCVQVYETYSRADYAINVAGQSAADYLVQLSTQLQSGWWVNFSSDPSVDWPSQGVAIPAPQLVIGLANAWAGPEENRTIFIYPADAAQAYARLAPAHRAPRGFAFWDIGDEGRRIAGTNETLFLAKALNEFLHTRRQV